MILQKQRDQHKAEFKNLENIYILCSLIDLNGLHSLNGLRNLYNPIYSKNFLVLINDLCAAKMTNTCPFLWN